MSTLINLIKWVASTVITVDPSTVPCADGSCNDSNIVGTIIMWAYIGLGIVGVIFLIVGGVQYITSEGEPEKTKKAQATITYTIIGLIVATAAAAILSFVTGAFS